MKLLFHDLEVCLRTLKQKVEWKNSKRAKSGKTNFSCYSDFPRAVPIYIVHGKKTHGSDLLPGHEYLCLIPSQ